MKLGYKAALQWVIDNDDVEWLKDADPIPSVTVVFMADVYDKSVEKVIADLRKRIKSNEDCHLEGVLL